jgi:hypothetical protein
MDFPNSKKIPMFKKIWEKKNFPGYLTAYRAVLNFMLPRNIHCLPAQECFEHSGKKILILENFGHVRILFCPKFSGT